MKKIYYIMIASNFLSCCSLFLTNNVILRSDLNNIKYDILSIITAWSPILILIPIGFLYSLTSINKKYDDAKFFTLCHLLILFSFAIIQFVFPSVLKKTGISLTNILIAVLSIASFILQAISISKLNKNNFDIKYELKMCEKITERLNQNVNIKLLERKLSQINIILIFCCMLNFSNYLYYFCMVACATINSVKLIHLRGEYLKIDGITNKQTILLFINYYLCCLLSALVYKNSSFLAFVFLLTNNIVIYIINNKRARMIYDNIESILNYRRANL